MRTIAVAFLLLSSVLFAETQEAAYFRAMKAEEAGDITSALKAFEDAEKLAGPYTEEIRDIIKQYRNALEVTENEQEPWSARILGDLGFYGLHYSEFGGIDETKENGSEMYVSIAPFLDYSKGEKLRSSGINFNANWFLNNDNMPALDTNDWKLTVGLEHSLITPTLLLDMGIDLNFAQGKDAALTFFSCTEKDFYRNERQRLGAAFWGYYDTDGPLSFAVYGAWHRTVPYGWNAGVYLGTRFEADYVTDYVGYLQAYQAVYEENQSRQDKDMCRQSPWDENCKDQQRNQSPLQACLEMYGDMCYNWGVAESDSLYWSSRNQTDTATPNISFFTYYAKWIGPALRSRVSYKFKRNITLEANLNLFYGINIDGPDSAYEKIKKFSSSWGPQVLWKPGAISLYLGLEQIYKHLSLPDYYMGIYPKNTLLSEIKFGLKWEL